MKMLKRVISITVLIAILVFPTSAFASSQTSYSSESKNKGFFSSLFTFFGGSSKSDDRIDYGKYNKDRDDEKEDKKGKDQKDNFWDWFDKKDRWDDDDDDDDRWDDEDDRWDDEDDDDDDDDCWDDDPTDSFKLWKNYYGY
ncbi:hypothetical protein I6N90_08670 [Paenibacillus sp. GSMTC-2017]|uniref:hypothetical protein n=1 Tax=Paenibacillus sp. GSMTC-2017 TaxID=2794350 RepID=UPI0018D668B7|nr:hypothetical protein [Paenibacillus sp. GSMTC-2017]MBH5317874.1 hypothetical protein [Paenibacillus sp. GSMTC-2017]